MFVDTNVLVYARVMEAPDHDVARELLAQATTSDEPAQLSRQVLREYLAVMTRPQTWPVPLTRDQVLDDVERLAANFQILEDGPQVTEALVALCREVPAAGTFNVADFRCYGDRIDVLDGTGRAE